MVTNNNRYRRKKLKVRTVIKEKEQQLLEFITIDVLKIEQQIYRDHDILTLPMTPIINSYFKKRYMLWELNHRRFLHHYGTVMEAMCHHQTLATYKSTSLSR